MGPPEGPRPRAGRNPATGLFLCELKNAVFNYMLLSLYVDVGEGDDGLSGHRLSEDMGGKEVGKQ